MKSRKLVYFIAVLALAGGVVALLATRSNPPANVVDDPEPAKPAQIEEVEPNSPNGEDSEDTSGDSSEETVIVVESSEPETEEEKAAAEEARKIEAFDSETDKWTDVETAKSPTMQDIYGFAEKFNALPEDRKDECLHRALNLLPDENIMLLVGILMDKTQKKEFVELIYNDVLNRSEDVKKPILKQIHSDKSHPCWADTAWILDVTGDKEH